LRFAAGWKAKATRDEENSKGDQVDLPIDKEEVQQRRLHKKSQPLEQLDEVIEEIRRLMLRSAHEKLPVKEKLSRRKPTIAAGKKQQQATKQWSRWTTPKNSLGSRWISTESWEAHEQELMNFSQ
jgi:hypothetical protein